jgi:predicted TIM-barrel fold metal-dependent hydrolase
MRKIYLHDYRPKSRLKVEEHIILKSKFPAIDCHGHFADFYCPLYSKPGEWIKPDISKIKDTFLENGIVKVVNLDGFWDGFFGISLEDILGTFSKHDDFFINFVSINTNLANQPNFEQYVRQHLKKSYELGAKGIKLFKHVSLMVEQSPGVYVPGRNIRIDDKRLSVIWETAAELNMPVLVHIADPEAFFDPVDEHNERYLELIEHPDWSYYGSGTYTFHELMEAQQNLLASNPETVFIVAHVGSNAENLKFVSQCLDKYDNMYIDIAARIDELGRQPYTSRKFFLQYQDRILFGTDVYSHNLKYQYSPYFRFLETWDEWIPGGWWPMYGIGLEDSVLEKIYYKNAEKILNL